MDFNLSGDQEALASAVDKIAGAFAAKPTEFHDFALTGGALERELEDGDYFNIATVPEWGPIGAVMAVDRLARCPYAVETALSMLVRPHLPNDAPRPVTLVEHGRPGRFVAGAKTVLVIDGDNIGIVYPSGGDTQRVESIFAYPMGRLVDTVTVEPLSISEAAVVRQWLQVAIAAEISGLIQAAIASTVEHISQRKQFGRPLGSFQALRHRMAECAVLAGGVKWLALKAADSAAPADAALAAYHAQDSAVRIAYECHQMLAAMGMTLEHPLHLWTYRLKALVSELGGRSAQAVSVAAGCFNGGMDTD
jgi:hypothetical protein